LRVEGCRFMMFPQSICVFVFFLVRLERIYY
jgi:hypothetical protein